MSLSLVYERIDEDQPGHVVTRWKDEDGGAEFFQIFYADDWNNHKEACVKHAEIIREEMKRHKH